MLCVVKVGAAWNIAKCIKCTFTNLKFAWKLSNFKLVIFTVVYKHYKEVEKHTHTHSNGKC